MVHPISKHTVTVSTDCYSEGLQPKHPNPSYPLSSKVTELTTALPQLLSSLRLVFLLLLPQAAAICYSSSSPPSIFLVNNAIAFKVAYASKKVSINQITQAGLKCNFTFFNESISGTFNTVKKCICSTKAEFSSYKGSTIDLYSQNTTTNDNQCMITELYQQICPKIQYTNQIAVIVVLSILGALVIGGGIYYYRGTIKNKCCSSYTSF